VLVAPIAIAELHLSLRLTFLRFTLMYLWTCSWTWF